MQKEVKTKDALLAEDVQYITPEGRTVVYRGPVSKAYKIDGDVYIAYPSVALPRFLIPYKDKRAATFILTIMSGDSGFRGLLLRIVVRLPGGIALLRRALFRECVVIAP